MNDIKIHQILMVDLRDFKEQLVKSNGELRFNVSFNDMSFPGFENVESVELKAINFPKMDNSEMYYILDIEEFSRRLHTSDNRGSHDTFAIVYYDNSGQSAGHMKPAKGKDFDEKIYVFNPCEKNLSKLHINFKKYGGSVIQLTDIDASESPATFLDKYPISLILDFTIIKVKSI